MSTKPWSNVQDKKKSTKVDNIPIGGDVTGEDAGEKKAGDVEGGKCKGVRVRVNKGEVKTESDVKNYFNCKICGTFTKNSYDYKKHLSKIIVNWQ